MRKVTVVDSLFCEVGIIQLNIRTAVGEAMMPWKVILPHRCNRMESVVGTIK